MKKFNYLILLILSFSCASRHKLMVGTVALKIDENRGIACLEPNTGKIGHHLKYLNNNCTRPTFPDQRGACQLVKAGEFEITKILNEHYVEFKKISGSSFNEGSIIESP